MSEAKASALWGLFDTPYGWKVERIVRETALTLYTEENNRRRLGQLIARFADRQTALDFRSQAEASQKQCYKLRTQAQEQHVERLNRIRFKTQSVAHGLLSPQAAQSQTEL